MTGRISRGWRVTGQSWKVLKRNPSLAVFPVMSTVFATVAVLAILIPATIALGFFGDSSERRTQVASYSYVAVLLLVGYIGTVIALFFNVALAAVAAAALRGEDVSTREGIRLARNRIRPILGWSLLTTTVGAALSVLPRGTGNAGSFASWLGGMAWGVATFFVVPVIAVEGTHAKQSLKRSGTIVREHWGEGATGATAIGVIGFALTFLILFTGMTGVALLWGINLLWAAVALGVIAAVALIATLYTSSALTGVFRVALYQFAVDGTTPTGFDPEMLEQSFAAKRGFG